LLLLLELVLQLLLQLLLLVQLLLQPLLLLPQLLLKSQLLVLPELLLPLSLPQLLLPPACILKLVLPRICRMLFRLFWSRWPCAIILVSKCRLETAQLPSGHTPNIWKLHLRQGFSLQPHGRHSCSTCCHSSDS